MSKYDAIKTVINKSDTYRQTVLKPLDVWTPQRESGNLIPFGEWMMVGSIGHIMVLKALQVMATDEQNNNWLGKIRTGAITCCYA
jgi:hypothetical protein